MKAVCSSHTVGDEDIGTPGSTTPVKQDSRKKKEDEDERKSKKTRISSGCWSQDSEIEEEVEKR